MTFNEEDAPAIGRAIYHEKIRPTLGPEHKGKIVVIDVKSGDYEIADGPLKGHLQERGTYRPFGSCMSGVRMLTLGTNGWTCR